MTAIHFSDRLTKAIQEKASPLCVGIDPRWQQLPLALREKHGIHSLRSVAAAYEEFGLQVVELVADRVPVIKPQSAFFEACGPAGMEALQKILARARELGVLSILDSKRNDIASTAQAYADAAFAGVRFEEQTHPVWHADAMTINPYLGRDAVEPFLASARKSGCGVFVLVRTSNPGAGLFQDLLADGQPIYQHVGKAVQAWTREHLGASGYGDVGAVVGATHPAELQLLRKMLPDVYFLIPGYGAQGGTASDAAVGFHKNGLGAIINSSRGITACFDPATENWQDAIVDAVNKTNKDLTQALGRPSVGEQDDS